jgi:murein DD-endopeptidase / murein LD-carboxypeptidase
MNEPVRFMSLSAPKRRQYARTFIVMLLSGLTLTLGACQSSRSISDRMESKYSLKKRKSYISCTGPEGLSDCSLPVKVPETAYQRMLKWIDAAKGTRYRYGGTIPDGFDCSGFVQYLYSLSYQMALPRTSGDLALLGVIVPRQQLRRGDLVFFSSGGDTVDHVGVFIGEGRFAHSATRAGVTVSSLQQEWYSTHFAFGTRVINVN